MRETSFACRPISYPKCRNIWPKVTNRTWIRKWTKMSHSRHVCPWKRTQSKYQIVTGRRISYWSRSNLSRTITIANLNLCPRLKIQTKEFPTWPCPKLQRPPVRETKVVYTLNHKQAKTIRWSAWQSRRFILSLSKYNKRMRISIGLRKTKIYSDRPCRLALIRAETRVRRGRRIWLSRSTVILSREVSSLLSSWWWVKECACSYLRSFGQASR